MKFFSQDKTKSVSGCKFFSKGFFLRFFASFLLILSLISSVFISPADVHAGFFSSIIAGISGDVSGVGFDQVQADVVVASTSQDVIPGNDNDSVLVAAVNSNLTPVPDCTVPVTDNTISSQLNPCLSATTTNTETSLYVVRSGDTLLEIATLFDVSVNTITSVNDLDPAAPLQAGETLYIPPVSGIEYTIKKGDTIQSIATYYEVGVQDILQYNDLTLTSDLNPGDTIIIPDATLDGPQNHSVSTVSSIKTTHKGRIPPRSRWGAEGSNPAHNTNGPYYPGYYQLPIAHGIETQGLHGYNAVDLAAPKGTPILASAAGTVVISLKNGGWNGGYGNYVVINHPNDTQTLYAHMSKVLVVPGETVAQGEVIGLLGATGEATGPHVHFEIHGARNPFANMTTW